MSDHVHLQSTSNAPSSGQFFGQSLRSVWWLIVAILVGAAILDPSRITEIVTIATRAFAGTLPYIAFAVALIAWMKASGAEHSLAGVFAGRETRMIVLAALIGGLAPFCSCEVVPFIAGLLAAGAPLSAIMAFWLSSPLIDPPTVLITAGALGWEYAAGKAVAAVGIGLMGGFAISALSGGGRFANPLKPGGALASGGCGTSLETNKPVWWFWRESKRLAVFWRELIANGLFLAKWLALAYVLEALLIIYVPDTLVASVIGGDGVWPIFVGAIIGAPAYINGYAAPALLSGLVDQGMSPGAAMSFMVAGAVTCIPAMAAVWALVRPSIFALYVTFGFIGAVIAGLAFDAIM